MPFTISSLVSYEEDIKKSRFQAFAVPVENEQGGEFIGEPEDLSGNYDYIPNVKSMGVPDASEVQALTQLMLIAKDPAAIQIRAQEGKRLKLTELEKDLFQTLGLKDTNKYYENITGGELLDVNQTGGGLPGGAEATGQTAGLGGMDQSTQTLAGSQNQPQLGGSTPV